MTLPRRSRLDVTYLKGSKVNLNNLDNFMHSVVNETDFRREVLEASRPVLVHFWTPWCGLCKLISPMLETMQQNHHQAIKLVSINADDNFKLANNYRLKNVPTIILFKDGEAVEKFDNIKSRDRLMMALEKIMDSTLSIP